VIRRTICQAFAPSTRAARHSSSGMLRMALVKTSMPKLAPTKPLTNNRISQGSVASQERPSMPNGSTSWLMTPYGLSAAAPGPHQRVHHRWRDAGEQPERPDHTTDARLDVGAEQRDAESDQHVEVSVTTT